MTRLIIAILFITGSQASFAGVYELKFQRVAAANDHGLCQAFAEKTASEFVSQSGASVIDAGCQEDDFTIRGWGAIITYQASAPLTRTTTYLPSVYSTAFFSDRNVCNARLAGQAQLFAKATGLKPLAAYCMLDASASPPMWETRVDGLGETLLQPGNAGLTYWGTLIDPKSVLVRVQSAAAGYGITPFEVGIDQMMGKHIVARFYSSEPYGFEDYDATKYGSATACASAASTVDTFMKSADKPVIVFCEVDHYGGTATLHTAAFVQILKPKSVFAAKALTTQFSTLAACQQATAAVASSEDVFGAICAGFDGTFRIHLFSK